MAKRSDMDHGLLLLIVAVIAWVIPGAGHFFIKEKKRAIIIFVTITATFALGLFIGSIAIIDPVGAWPWYVGQMLTSPGVALIGQAAQNATQLDPDGQLVKLVSYGKPHDFGQIYTAIAGAMNLLAILSAVFMAHSGRGEIIGREEDE
jgi:hypothetical protein